MTFEVLAYITPAQYYETLFGPHALSQNQLCPFHEDSRPSLKIFDSKMGAAKCHASTCRRGFPHYVALHKALHNFKTDEEAATDIWQKHFRLFESPKRISLMHEELLSRPSILKLLKTERLLDDKTIEREKIGYDIHYRRIALPVWLTRKCCIGFRYWLPKTLRESRPDEPKIFHDKGTPPILFNAHVLVPDIQKKTPVYFMGSELDALLAGADGYLAVSGMVGEGKFDSRWVPFLEGRHVVLAIGRDDPDATTRMRNALASRLEAVSIGEVVWPEGKGKDYTDFRKAGLIDGKFLGQYVRPERGASRSNISTVEMPDPRNIEIQNITDPENINVPLRLRAIISSISSKPYIVGRSFSITWQDPELTGPQEGTYDITDPREYLYFIDRHENTWPSFFGKRLKLSKKCVNIEAKALTHVDLHELQLTPDITTGKDSTYVQRTGFSVGIKPDSNLRCEIEGTCTPLPHDQSSVVIITSMKDLGTRSTKLTKEQLDYLRDVMTPLRSAKTVDDLHCGFEKVMNCIAVHHTRIAGRPDLHLTLYLTYLSPLHFTMENRSDHRGWCNGLILGDSRTGKTDCTSRFQTSLFRAGEIVSAENCSIPGLIGAVQQGRDNRPMVVWAKLPRNNGGLVVMEELSGMSVHDISRMTDVRSSGIARIDKWGITHQAQCKTRLIMLANPRQGTAMGRHTNAMRVITGLLGANEDIARTDIILSQTSDEVSIETIHEFQKINPTKIPHVIPDDGLRMLLSHSWSLDNDQVLLSEKAQEKARTCAVELSKKFHYEIPIFKVEDGRYKLARAAAAAAVGCLSESKSGERIHVKSIHVEWAKEFYTRLWTSKSFGYDQWSSGYIQGLDVNEARLEKALLPYIGEREAYLAFCSMLADRDSVSYDDVQECAATDRSGANAIIRVLFKERVVTRIPDPNNPHSRPRWNLIAPYREYLQRLSKH